MQAFFVLPGGFPPSKSMSSGRQGSWQGDVQQLAPVLQRHIMQPGAIVYGTSKKTAKVEPKRCLKLKNMWVELHGLAPNLSFKVKERPLFVFGTETNGRPVGGWRETSGRPAGDKRDTSGTSAGDQRETKGRPAGDQRETGGKTSGTALSL